MRKKEERKDVWASFLGKQVRLGLEWSGPVFIFICKVRYNTEIKENMLN
ncbi:MAG: hypothetical protein JJU01_06565 [Alkalibacterium sp.]|nr:hypothetical protein [Alkalibacterium sp.]